MLQGFHPSRRSGTGLEFAQYRSYQQGDDPRRVDWRLYARSDRFFVRESETERDFAVRLVLDASASMAHLEDDGPSKFDYARFVLATLAVLAERQGDAVALDVLGADGRRVPARHGRQHVTRLIHQLETLAPGGRWPAAADAVAPLVGASRSIAVVVTDLVEHADEIRALLRQLARRRHEAIVLELFGRRELTLDYGGPVALEDLETGRVVEVDPGRARAAFTRALAGRDRALRAAFGAEGVRWRRVVTDEPLDAVLRAVLAAREAMA